MSQPITTHEAWRRLATHASAIVELADLPDFNLQMEDEVTGRWCDAFDGITECLAVINANKESDMPDWRNDPLRTRTRQDDQTRLQVHLIRNRRRHHRLTHNEAADILEDMGIDPAGVLRILGEFIRDEECEANTPALIAEAIHTRFNRIFPDGTALRQEAERIMHGMKIETSTDGKHLHVTLPADTEQAPLSVTPAASARSRVLAFIRQRVGL